MCKKADEVITEEMVKAGEDAARSCVDASVHKAFYGKKGLKKFIKAMPENNDLVEQYADDKLLSVEVIYLAMCRARG